MDRQNVTQQFLYEYESPIGILCIWTDGEGITGLATKEAAQKATTHRETARQETEDAEKCRKPVSCAQNSADGRNSELPPVVKQLTAELSEYFAGTRTEFTVPVRVEGTAFQKAVWELLKQIPYGETRTYGELARAMGKKGAARAVGGACHVNPVLLLVPCHRVIGADGRLTGFAGGLIVKEALLKQERKKKTAEAEKAEAEKAKTEKAETEETETEETEAEETETEETETEETEAEETQNDGRKHKAHEIL